MPHLPAAGFWRRSLRLLAGGLAIGSAAAGLAAAWWIGDELASSRLQAKLLSGYGKELHFEVEPGPSSAVRFPDAGPWDDRFGYSRLPRLVERLERQGYAVTGQARMSSRMIELVDAGVFAPYHEKSQAGLELADCRAEPLFSARYPARVYERFESVPALLVRTLLFIENRELLEPGHATRNPAVEWDRLAKVVVDQLRHMVDETHPAHGGSTLATQIEKYRHSPEGRTSSAREKLRQMASASLRAYLDGEDTTQRRRRIVVDYLNTVPLAARAGFGEVNGLGDGLHAWYGRDFAEVNALLAGESGEREDSPERLRRRALAYKQALSLMVAQRRPSHYLLAGREDLGELTDSHLRLLAEAGVVSPALRDAALGLQLDPASPTKLVSPPATVDRKASTALRNRLASLLGIDRSYELDRLDLAATTTLDGDVQREITRRLRALATPAGARAAGLYGFRLFGEKDDPSRLTFSFTLYERGPRANLLRVQTDSGDGPFDVNDGARLDLGSTSKLRTLVTYLEIVAALHARWSGLPAAELARTPVAEGDAIGLWARDWLTKTGGERSLAEMLDAAMARRYSADPSEVFFTGGGLHRFDNFDRRDDSRVVDVREALRNSVNLPFIRMMRDIVRHTMHNAPGSSATILVDRADPKRREYLASFADFEGAEFLSRFYRRYRGKSAQEAESLLLARVRGSPARLASVYHGLEPETGADELGDFLDRRLGSELPDSVVESLHERYGADSLSLTDRGHVAGLHPLELWLVGFLRQNPEANLEEVLAASRGERQQAYEWLFRTRNKEAQDLRIRMMLEREAFREIHRSWRRLGYPFDSLTPSYAASLGASGDRPSALAELMGIIVSDGVRMPVERIDSIVLARDTPYETHLGHRPPQAERVMPAEVARVLRKALVDVVEDGTARRLRGTIAGADGRALAIGGKTGTGDHRYDVHGRGGQLISSRVVNRTATFVFLIGERYYGTIMAYVGEPHAADFRFTSALPTQLLKSLLPTLEPLLARRGCLPGVDPEPQAPGPTAPAPAGPAPASPGPANPALEASTRPADKLPTWTSASAPPAGPIRR